VRARVRSREELGRLGQWQELAEERAHRGGVYGRLAKGGVHTGKEGVPFIGDHRMREVCELCLDARGAELRGVQPTRRARGPGR
jgi:hypothetical protein